jgi:hypothetical protein
MAVRITRAGVGLTVGIIILALVVLGGLYLVRERGEQARRDDAIEIAQENLESETEGGTLSPEIQEDEQAAEEEPTPSDQPSPNENDQPAQDETVATASPEQLPATGPTDGMALLVIALLSFTVVSYAASRRALAKLQ